MLSDSQLKNLEEAFEQVKYYVEDLDHANGNSYYTVTLLIIIAQHHLQFQLTRAKELCMYEGYCDIIL